MVVVFDGGERTSSVGWGRARLHQFTHPPGGAAPHPRQHADNPEHRTTPTDFAETLPPWSAVRQSDNTPTRTGGAPAVRGRAGLARARADARALLRGGPRPDGPTDPRRRTAPPQGRGEGLAWFRTGPRRRTALPCRHVDRPYALSR